MDVIQPSNSHWSSPLHMVEKSSRGWRACGDYRALNVASEYDRYPMPHLQDFTIQLEWKSIFSKVDLVRAYNEVPMNASDIAKTAIVTPFRLFEYKRRPFGLNNAAQTFQRLMDNVLTYCSFACVYLDDILVASSSVDEHQQHLRQLFRKVADYWLVVNPQKGVFGQSSLECLVHYVTSTTGNVVHRPQAAYVCLQKHIGQVVASPATTSLFRFRVHHRHTLRSRRRQCSGWCTVHSTCRWVTTYRELGERFHRSDRLRRYG